ncbi:MAG TPA: hypothetical protein VGN26_08395 [Armatimonadota bacterium]|jgi:pyruvate dehydrogenase (quinone)/pyruvate oxidase
MATTAGDVLVDTLGDRGVDTAFGIAGDGINGIMAALRQRRDEVRLLTPGTRGRSPPWLVGTPS